MAYTTETFYDEFGNKFNYQLKPSQEIGINIGCCGRVYQQKDKILKVYYTDCDESGRLTKSVADIINQMNDPHIPKTLSKRLNSYKNVIECIKK